MKNQLLPNPPAIIQFSEIGNMSEMILRAQEQKKFKNSEELIYFLSHNINNKIHENGRIYMQINKDGSLFAHSVSPYSETFTDNVENGVKDLVKVLRSKRYLTYSSCEGHGNSFRRYVGLAFADEASRNVVEQYISSLKIKGIILKKFDTVSNQSTNINNETNKIEYQNKINPLLLEGDKLQEHKAQETEYFNISFHRKYENYCFLEIVILEEINWNKFFKNPLYISWIYFMKKYKWDKITAKLTTKLQDKKFHKYPY